jgi:hypothetical protein
MSPPISNATKATEQDTNPTSSTSTRYVFFFVVIVFVVVLEFMTHAGILAVQMSEFFNQKSSVPGKIPSGFFNSVFGFRSDSWATDAADTKFLGLDGYFIILFNVRIDRFALVLSDEVREAVPTSWDPFALAR